MANLDQVILIDDNNQPIGKMDKIEAHMGEGKLHRAISVYIFNNQGQLLIQQRSKKKIVGALEWANTACGNVRPGESAEGCAYRRLREELGIEELRIKHIYTFQYKVRCNDEFSENEIDDVFVGFYQGEVKANLDEVLDYKWADFDKLQADFVSGKLSLKLVPWFEIMLNKKDLLKKIKQIVQQQ